MAPVAAQGSQGHHVGIDGHALLPVPVHLRQQPIVAVRVAGPRREHLSASSGIAPSTSAATVSTSHRSGW